jgi:hypothetical protein
MLLREFFVAAFLRYARFVAAGELVISDFEAGNLFSFLFYASKPIFRKVVGETLRASSGCQGLPQVYYGASFQSPEVIKSTRSENLLVGN